MKIFSKTKKAFTLVEVMIAVGVIAVSITSMVGLLGSITANISQIRHQQKAMSSVAHLETILRTKHFNEIYRWVANPAEPYVIYFWDEYQNKDDPDNSSLITMSSESEGGTPNTPPTQETLRDSEGDVYRVLLTVYQNGLKGEKVTIGATSEYNGGGLGGDASTYALSYLPIYVEIYAEPRQDITNGQGTDQINESRRVFDTTITKRR